MYVIMFTWLYAYAQPTIKLVLIPNLNPENFFSPKLRTNSLDCNYNFTSLTMKMGGGLIYFF